MTEVASLAVAADGMTARLYAWDAMLRIQLLRWGLGSLENTWSPSTPLRAGSRLRSASPLCSGWQD